jgi:hypothetical protein
VSLEYLQRILFANARCPVTAIICDDEDREIVLGIVDLQKTLTKVSNKEFLIVSRDEDRETVKWYRRASLSLLQYTIG